MGGLLFSVAGAVIATVLLSGTPPATARAPADIADEFRGLMHDRCEQYADALMRELGPRALRNNRDHEAWKCYATLSVHSDYIADRTDTGVFEQCISTERQRRPPLASGSMEYRNAYTRILQCVRQQ